MVSDSSQSGHPDSMRVNGESVDLPASLSSSSKQSISTEKRKVRIEDSMEVISESISEIQSSEAPPSLHTVDPQDHPKTSLKQTGQLWISLAWKLKSGNSSLTFLPLLQKFFHALLATGTITILPICNDSKAHPLKLSSQINKLTVVGSKTFLKKLVSCMEVVLLVIFMYLLPFLLTKCATILK
jgi:hypothetical protein